MSQCHMKFSFHFKDKIMGFIKLNLNKITVSSCFFFLCFISLIPFWYYAMQWWWIIFFQDLRIHQTVSNFLIFSRLILEKSKTDWQMNEWNGNGIDEIVYTKAKTVFFCLFGGRKNLIRENMFDMRILVCQILWILENTLLKKQIYGKPWIWIDVVALDQALDIKSIVFLSNFYLFLLTCVGQMHSRVCRNIFKWTYSTVHKNEWCICIFSN